MSSASKNSPSAARKQQTSQEADPERMQVDSQADPTNQEQGQAPNRTSPPATNPAAEQRHTNSAGEQLETPEERLGYLIEEDSKKDEVEAGRAYVATEVKKQKERDALNPR
ncbi:hypothetical protein LTR36_009213 [Oleoguttula mirabilis]|uniref:Uncharacterized protein n=1 Tax=Oleoguttula mirabilis TaxID=1507867 RepID=A0AAV9J644_9PEZI|nr:hypothetical protein LTR36_009213 [Oleoguttula mirabilis]